MSQNSRKAIVRPKTKRGERALKDREPQLVETVKKALLIYGNHPSQVVKDILTDLHKLEPRETVKYTRRNDDLQPFDGGGEVKLEHYSQKTDCGQFVLANHSKKRPHSLVFGRFFDHRIYDLLEVGVENYKSINAFKSAATAVQPDNKPCFVFDGEQFEHDSDFAQAKSMILDLFRGQVVKGVNLIGIDHVIYVTAVNRTIYFRQYAIKLKKSGTTIPRIDLTEMGPSMDLTIKRCRAADPELKKKAFQQTKQLTKKKEKNISSDPLDGRVGRIYLPTQKIAAMPQHKMKAFKRNLETEGPAPATKKNKLA